MMPPLPSLRLGGGKDDAEEVKKHIFFESINWDDLYHRRVSVTLSLYACIMLEVFCSKFLRFHPTCSYCAHMSSQLAVNWANNR